MLLRTIRALEVGAGSWTGAAPEPVRERTDHRMTGIEAFLEILASAGVTHLFGNPGTTELPLNVAVTADPRFRYLFAIQEIPVVSMADGYAMASGSLGFCNVHAACGLGNAMGMIYNAHIEGTPLLITAGQQDRRLRLGEPVLEADLVSVARPWTRWAHEIQRVQDIPNALRRAIQVARTPPTGPVFLSLPLDIQTESATGLDLSPPHLPDPRARPPLGALEQAVALLQQARHPVIVAGSRVTETDACQELLAVAEKLGAPIYAEGTPSHGRLPVPADHPQYRGVLPYWSPEIRAVLADCDVLLAVGVSVFRLYIHCEPERPLPESVQVIHVDNVAWEIGKNLPVAVGLLSDPKTTLAELAERLPSNTGRTHPDWAAVRAGETDHLRATIASQSSIRPMTPLTFMDALNRALPSQVAVVEEAITTHQNLLERLGTLRDPRAFFAHRGWCLGWGMGCALGVKLAWPDRPVLGLIGDGAALYGIQALWSAAHHRIPVTFVIANNAQYQILKVCGDVMGLPATRDPKCPGLNLVNPEIDYVGLARSLGVAARRVSEPDELTDCVRSSLLGDQPQLFEVPIAR